MTVGPFAVGRLPRIDFGAGRFSVVPDVVGAHGRRALVVTGRRSFRASERWPAFVTALADRGVEHEVLLVEGEPSPDVVDDAVARLRPSGIEVVAGVGGGSVLDTAKAVAGLLRSGTSILDHLEEVGRGLPYPGPTVPFVAVPTTAGTGSEATKNAVLSIAGRFKRSFRDDRLVAADAIVDPDLLVGLAPGEIAANGMDALAQLLEAYVSLRASPFTDALALSGLEAARDGLLTWHAAVVETRSAGETAGPRAAMAWAALASGICLAQAGLGVVHGLAAPLGAFFPIRHGEACGAVLAAGVEANIRALATRQPASDALRRYAVAGRRLAGLPPETPDQAAQAGLVATLRGWAERLGVRGLATFGVTRDGIDPVVGGSRAGSMRTNPIVLDDDELAGILEASI